MYIVCILIERSKPARPKENAPHEQGIILIRTWKTEYKKP
jgi:hypothetical protein